MSELGSNWNVTKKKTGGRVAVPSGVRLAQGERVKALREKLGLTQEKVADAGDFPRADMSRFEKGAKLSAAANQEKLARGFGLPLEAFRTYLAGGTTLAATVLLVGTSDRSVSPDKYERILRVGARLGRPSAEALRIAEATRGYKSTTTETEIASWFGGPSPSGDVDRSDDLSGGAGSLPRSERVRVRR